jgi:hypothetical protein
MKLYRLLFDQKRLAVYTELVYILVKSFFSFSVENFRKLLRQIESFFRKFRKS